MSEPNPTPNDSLTANDDLALQLYRALRLTPCRCTEPKFWQNIPAVICSRCLALGRFETERPADAARFAS